MSRKKAELSGSDKLLQLKLCHLLTCADGKCAPEQKRMLMKLRDNAGMASVYLTEFDQFRSASVVDGSALNKVRALLDEESFSALHHDKRAQAETLWYLIDLSYADGKYSPQERQIVTHLVSRWGIDKLLIEEMVGAAEAILALNKQKTWVKETKKPYKEIEAMIQEIDRNIASLYEDTKASAFDADIA